MSLGDRTTSPGKLRAVLLETQMEAATSITTATCNSIATMERSRLREIKVLELLTKVLVLVSQNSHDCINAQAKLRMRTPCGLTCVNSVFLRPHIAIVSA